MKNFSHDKVIGIDGRKNVETNVYLHPQARIGRSYESGGSK